MESIDIIKFVLMIVFFAEVVIFGKFISNLSCFREGNIMSIALTFSGTLFLSIALLDIIPQAISIFNSYLDLSSKHHSPSTNFHRNGNLPMTMMIALVTFMIIMYIDKIMIGHSHDHQYQLSFAHQPKKSIRQVKDDFKQQPVSSNQIQENKQINYRPLILQAGMSIHAFFQCLAVGLQKTPISLLGLASAIIVHKWAQGLTLGLIYSKQGYTKKTITIMIVIQGFINVIGLLVGTVIANRGDLIMACFMSISAGTFLYISLAEVLIQQIKTLSKLKSFSMIIAITFVSFLVLFQKNTQNSQVQ